MTLSELEASLQKSAPPAGSSPALAALWWARKDNWDKAHRIVMDEGGKDCAWVHAYLHRVEGDQRNAAGWPGAPIPPDQVLDRVRGLPWVPPP